MVMPSKWTVLSKLLRGLELGCNKPWAQWVPTLVNKHRRASVHTQRGPRQGSAVPGQLCLPWIASCSLKGKLLGLNRSGWVSLDMCLKTDAPHLNSNRRRRGDGTVAQGEKILKRIPLLKHLSNTMLEREMLGSGVIL